MGEAKRNEKGFVIIGAGLPRTGTTTLKHVLEDLLGKPCYHMTVVMAKADHLEFWSSAVKGKEKSEEEWRNILKDYGAGVDTPLCLFVKELMEVYPDAKVLLSVRDPEKWYYSIINTTAKFTKLINTKRGRLFWFVLRPTFTKCPEFLADCHRAFLGENWSEENKEDYIYHYRKHIEEIKRIVPKDKLLIFDVREGYQPLCKFLGVPTREESLPRLNEMTRISRFIMAFDLFSWGLIIAVPILITVPVIYFFSYRL